MDVKSSTWSHLVTVTAASSKSACSTVEPLLVSTNDFSKKIGNYDSDPIFWHYASVGNGLFCCASIYSFEWNRMDTSSLAFPTAFFGDRMLSSSAGTTIEFVGSVGYVIHCVETTSSARKVNEKERVRWAWWRSRPNHWRGRFQRSLFKRK